MFGCDFSTIQGKYNRGVYGTYFKFAKNKGYFSNLVNCEGIFVIDTEGLFSKDSLNEGKKDFDYKIVLFCLAVSDFVVINFRGILQLSVQKLIRFCYKRLEDLKIQKEKRA